MKTLGIVLKVAERCNINCSYCYFFNGLDTSYKKRPAFISRDTIKATAEFLSEGVKELNINSVSVGLHGGEPMMQNKEDFIYLVDSFNEIIDAEVSFNVQTNAILANDKWIDIFNSRNIMVGVSIDGPRAYHDKYRVDHFSSGTYDRVEKGIKLLMGNLHEKPGSLTVINPEFNGKEIYYHLVDLGFKNMDFLLPDNTHDHLPSQPISKYGEYLKDICKEWLTNNNNTVTIRILKSIFCQLLGDSSLIYGFGHNNTNDLLPLITIRSNGDISAVDELMSTDPITVAFLDKNVHNNSLIETLSVPIFNELIQATQNKPHKCTTCCWWQACGGGTLVSRFSKVRRFNNPSIYCEALQEVIPYLANQLVQSGVELDVIKNNLKIGHS